MSKSIYELIPDIYSLLKDKGGWFSEQLATNVSKDISIRLQTHFNAPARTPTLRLSQMGPRCPRALWYSIHHPELAEPLQPWAEVKFAYGHILEALAIPLAKAAGHHVCGEQDELELDGIIGHRDCVIDGCTVDIKSTSSIGFQKFKNKTLQENDSFGYLDQLDGYVVAARLDPLVTVKDKGYILAIDKTLGHCCVYEHKVTDERVNSIKSRIAEFKEYIRRDTPPACNCKTVGSGASGNLRLDTKASYSPYKHVCFPFLRTFIYDKGPVYLSKVVRVPDVKEVNKEGRVIYH